MANDELTTLLTEQLAAVPSESIVFRVAQSLLQHLTSGAVAPGTRLPSERQLAASMNVGRSAVREALASLDLLGIVSIRPGSGTYLRETNSEILTKAIDWGLMLGQPRVLDLVEVRQSLEVQSAMLAAQRATDAEVELLAEQIKSMQAATHDVARFVELDVDFHLRVAQLAHNSVLSDILRSVRSLLLAWVERTSVDEEVVETSLDEHKRVFESIQNHDVEGARAAMQSHMDIASGRLRDSLAASVAKAG